MSKMRKIISLALVLLLTAAFGTGCFGRPETEYIGGDSKRTQQKDDKDTGNDREDGNGDNADAIGEDADSRTAFVTGAKQMMSADLMGGEDESDSPLGIFSDLLHDINNRSHEALLTFEITDLVSDGESSDDSDVFINLSTAYDMNTADASLEIAMGMGSEEASQSGIYLTGDTAILKSASVDQNIILYEMPAGADYTGMTFTDRMAGILGSLNGDEDTASIEDNAQTREELAARHLDPWMEDTDAEEYSEQEQSRTILGSDETCRVITLTMTGERAHTFLVEKLKALDADPDFTGMTGMLGGESGLTGDLMSGVVSESGDEDATEIVADLEAMTPEQIAALVFTASLLIYDEQAVGFGMSINTDGYDMALDILAYERELEHQLSLSYRPPEGGSFTLDLSKISTGADGYDVSMSLSSIDETGLETMAGRYGGVITQNESEYDLYVDYTLDFQSDNEDTGSVGHSSVSGTLTYNQPPSQDDGYAGQGQMVINVESADVTFSATLNLSVDVQFPDSVSIVTPMYTQSNVTQVSDEQGLYEALGLDYASLSEEGALSRVMALVVSIIMG